MLIKFKKKTLHKYFKKKSLVKVKRKFENGHLLKEAREKMEISSWIEDQQKVKAEEMQALNKVNEEDKKESKLIKRTNKTEKLNTEVKKLELANK